MDCREARRLMSDYLEEYLADSEADVLMEHLADCEECRAELAELDQMLDVVHGLPRQTPVSDLWEEFAPKFAEIRAEMRAGIRGRTILYFAHLWDAIIEGWTIFVSAVRYNTKRWSADG